MANAARTVVVQLTAQVGNYVAGMNQAANATTGVANAQNSTTSSSNNSTSALGRLNNAARTNADSWDKAGKSLLAYGVGAVAALGAVAKAAMGWQTAWAGVTKTVDGSPEEMAALEGGLRNLAKTLPITHAEIAGVAEAAGQLGVARKDVVGFTKTMVDLGVSTNLTAEDAATNIAQISNVMGTMSREGSLGVARFGSALVALGNDGASTEAEILAMAQRIAGAGATVGATEVEVLALSNTLASMGIQAELGGGVTTRVLLKMFSAVQEGGPKLEAFARTAGVTAEEFGEAYKRSPMEALNLVAQGLNKVSEEGGNTVAVMKDLGIKGTQETQVMLSLANSGDLLTDSLKLGATAWEENTALVEEATKRYDTAESKIRIAWNNIKDAAITAGGAILPVISEVADMVAKLANWFGQLPAPVQAGAVVIAGLTAVIALLAGGFLVLYPRMLATVTAFRTLGVSAGTAALAMKRLALAMGIAGVVVAAAVALKELVNSMEPAVATTNQMTQALQGLEKNSGALDDMFDNIDYKSGGALLEQVHNVGDALAAINADDFNSKVGQFGNNVLGIDNDFSKLEDTISNLDQSMAGLTSSGNMEVAARGFKQIAEQAKEQGLTMDQLKERFPAYMDSLRQLAVDTGVQVDEADLLNWAMGKTPQVMLDAAAASEDAAKSAEEQAAASEEAAQASEEFAEAMAELGLATDGTIIALDKYTEALFASGLAVMSSREAAFGWEETMRGMAAQIAEVGNGVNATGTDFDKMSEAGAKANGVFQGIIQEGMGVASTFAGDLSKSAADVNLQLQSTYDAGVQAAIGLGLGEEAAIALTREVMQIPPGVSIETWMDEQAKRMAGETSAAANEIPAHVAIQTSMDNAAFKVAGQTKKAADDVPDQVTIDSWMADEAFVEAIRTRAAAEGIPPDVAIDSFMQSAARNEADGTTSAVLRIPKGTSISSYMAEYARLEAERLEATLNRIDGRTVNTYATHHETVIREAKNINTGTSDQGYSQGGGTGGRGGLATGGRMSDFLDGYPGGGRLPGSRSANILKDNLVGTAQGKVFGLQGTEWVINPRSSEAYDPELEAINNGSFPKGVLSAAVSGGGRTWAAPPATATATGGKVEKHFHTHISPTPGMEQSYAKTIAREATQRQQDLQLAYGID